MFRKLFYYPLLLLFIGVLYWSAPVFSHDAFYPHHRDDFESMTRRRQLRGTVLLSTAVFLCVLGSVVYVALRKIRDTDDADESEARTVQERLESAANKAADAAKHVLNVNGSVAEAAETALTTYAEVSGGMWRQHSDGKRRAESVPYQIRCKIGTDVVTLNINAKVIQLKAEHNSSKTGFGSHEAAKGVSTNIVLRIADEEEE